MDIWRDVKCGVHVVVLHLRVSGRNNRKREGVKKKLREKERDRIAVRD